MMNLDSRTAIAPLASAFAVLMTSTAVADAPRVATDIAPVHSLVAMVMEGAGSPDLIIPPGASPHGYSMRPSEARALSDAGLVFWIGPALSPWLEDPIETLAPDALHISLLDSEGTQQLENSSYEAGHHDDDHDDHGEHDDHADEHEHGDEHDHGDDDGHDDHGDEHGDEHGHDDHGDEHGDEHGHDDHGDEHGDEHGHDDHAGHDHGPIDPHAWLDPQNASAWLTVIADALSAADPENAALYQSNAAAGQERLAALEAEIAADLAAAGAAPFVVYHDAFAYFETRFGLESAGSILPSEATPPSPARVAEIADIVADQGITCVFAEPQYDDGLVASVMPGQDRRVAVLDPLGVAHAPGAALYEATLRDLAGSLKACLTGS